MQRFTTMFGLCLAVGLGASCALEAGASEDVGVQSEALRRDREPEGVQNVLLVHGAWADGSCWSSVIRELQRNGYNARAVQLREQTLADDAALVRHAIEQFDGPLVAVGHSYGGFVISEAATGAENVKALVYVAAFAPEEGETLAALTTGHETPALANLVVDDLGEAIIEPEAFVRHFAQDLPVRDARVLAAVQKPTAVGILGAVAGPPAWHKVPSYFQISLDDQVIAPALQQMFAERMKATTIELDASHASLLSLPRAVANLIARAASEH